MAEYPNPAFSSNVDSVNMTALETGKVEGGMANAQNGGEGSGTASSVPVSIAVRGSSAEDSGLGPGMISAFPLNNGSSCMIFLLFPFLFLFFLLFLFFFFSFYLCPSSSFFVLVLVLLVLVLLVVSP